MWLRGEMMSATLTERCDRTACISTALERGKESEIVLWCLEVSFEGRLGAVPYL